LLAPLAGLIGNVTNSFISDTSLQFHQYFTRAFLYEMLAPKITKLNVTIEKLPKRLMYEKGVQTMLMKLTPGHLSGCESLL